MISYLILSYVVMFFFGFVIAYKDNLKKAIKVWLFAPVSMPMIAVALIIGW